MKYFAVLLFSLLAQKSFAKKCDHKVETRKLHQTYVDAAKYVSLPDGEYDDIIIKFKGQYIESAMEYGVTLINRTYDWAVEIAEELINDGQNRNSELQKCIESDKQSNGALACLEYSLENLTKQLEIFLELIPGNALIKRRPLPDLQPQPEMVVPIKKPSPSDIFVNLAQTFNDDLENFGRLVVTVHREGWQAIRPLFDAVQAEFREKILNKEVLPKYRLFVDEALKFREWIEPRVKLELWESFERACDRVIAISDDWKATYIEEDCD